MAKIMGMGFDQLEKELQDLASQSGNIATKALYEGSGYMADKLRNATENLQTEDQRRKPSKAVLDYEKTALLKGLTVEKFKTDVQKDSTYTAITFHGRSDHRTKKYPDGIPIVILARSIVTGTPFRQANRFFPNAVNRHKQAAEDLMVKTAENEIRKLIK